MSNKKINPDNLSRVNGAFKDMSGELEHNVSDLISSSATEKLQAATDGIKKLSKEMVETISSLDEYLGAVGEAFRSVDSSMAIPSKNGMERSQKCTRNMSRSLRRDKGL